MRRRLSYIDNAKGIGILIVVLAHMYEAQSPVRVFAYAFHMPLFFLIAGMMGKYTEEYQRPFPQIVIKKFRTLLIPYFFFEIIAIIGYLLISKNFSTSAMMGGIKNSVLLYCTAGATWFLPTLFLAEIVFHLFYKFIKSGAHVLWINIAICAIILYVPSDNHIIVTLSRSMIAACFYSFGFLIFDKLDSMNQKWILLFLPVFAVSTTINGQVDLFYLNLGVVPFYVMSSISGSVLVILLCKRYLNEENRVISFYGQNSLTIMGTHLFIFYGIFRDFLGLDLFVPWTAWLMFFCICLLEIPICLIINRVFPYGIGRVRKNGIM